MVLLNSSLISYKQLTFILRGACKKRDVIVVKEVKKCISLNASLLKG